jgi:NAD(P)-dependent dehydrogenase (short-subunit alcohol dehydrogenase family)
MELEGKTAIVVGASRGLGRTYALALAQAGASVVVAARTEREPAPATGEVRVPGELHAGRAAAVMAGALPGTIYETVAQIEALGGRALPVRCDATREDEARALVATTLERFGRVDVLVYNAGLVARFATLEVTPEIFDHVFHVNLLGAYLCAKHVLPHMMARRSGSIINITSGGRNRGGPRMSVAEGILCYTVTKAAMNRLTTYLAQEVAPSNVAVNALAPGMVITEGAIASSPEDYDWQNPEGPRKPNTLEVVGPPVVWLARQTAETFTGRIVLADEFGTPDWGAPYP